MAGIAILLSAFGESDDAQQRRAAQQHRGGKPGGKADFVVDAEYPQHILGQWGEIGLADGLLDVLGYDARQRQTHGDDRQPADDLARIDRDAQVDVRIFGFARAIGLNLPLGLHLLGVVLAEHQLPPSTRL